MRTLVAVIVGRMVRIVTRLRGGGSALPGWCALKIHPRFLHQVFADLAGRDEIPVIVVTGSNGKSTTTSMIVSALESQGHTVFSNPSGGNLPQGVASAVLADVSLLITVRVSSKLSVWSSIPNRNPLRRITFPESGTKAPDRMRSNVDLPSPLRPTIPIRSPECSAIVRDSKIVRCGNSWEQFSIPTRCTSSDYRGKVARIGV